jgi:hypothetical protein
LAQRRVAREPAGREHDAVARAEMNSARACGDRDALYAASLHDHPDGDGAEHDRHALPHEGAQQPADERISHYKARAAAMANTIKP